MTKTPAKQKWHSKKLFVSYLKLQEKQLKRQCKKYMECVAAIVFPFDSKIKNANLNYK